MTDTVSIYWNDVGVRLEMAIAKRRTALPRICPNCGYFPLLQSKRAARCEDCKLSLSIADHDKFMEAGRDASQFGIAYRRRYMEAFRRHGRITAMFSLSDPSIVEAFVAGAIISGHLGNGSYDITKALLRRLVKWLKDRAGDAHRRKAMAAFVTTGDRKLLDALLKGEFASHPFVRGIEEYCDGFPNTPKVVRDAIQEEKFADKHGLQIAELGKCLHDAGLKPGQFLYSLPGGRTIHRADCPHLAGKSPRQVAFGEAVKGKLKPCKRCLKSGIDGSDW